MRVLGLLLRRKLSCMVNRSRSQTRWEWGRNTAFAAVGIWMLCGLHYGFARVLGFLSSVELIGELLIWKLTAMALLTTFAMTALSSLVISLSTLFYASDLPFLMRSPLPLRSVFVDKSVETAFFSSWMIALALAPFVLALGKTLGLGWGFYMAFLLLAIPFLLLACSGGMLFTLALMYAFPSSRTRDAVWALSSASASLVYVLIRLSKPERLIRPDALRLVAEYLGYLQAPTAPYAPSWWLTRAMSAFARRDWPVFLGQGALLAAAAAALYGLLLWLSGFLYARGYSGAQEGRRRCRGLEVPASWEARLASAWSLGAQARCAAVLFWRERTCFARDVKHWSQIVLIGAIVCVYLFSIANLPLDTPELKSLICFANIGLAGFVLASLCLRFTFPAVSLEGRSWWFVRSSPLTLKTLMAEKLAFSLLPILAVATALVATSNHLLQADPFIRRLTLATIWAASAAMCSMAVGLGALFPRFQVENIHQIESSAGGFAFMACALGYVGFLVAAESLPVRMHFLSRFGRPDAWDGALAALCAASAGGATLLALILPWKLGRANLETYEEK